MFSINPMQNFTPPIVLPLVFDRSITLQIKIANLLAKTNEIIALINTWETDYKDYTNLQISLLRNELITVINDLSIKWESQRLDDLNNIYRDLKLNYDSLILVIDESNIKNRAEMMQLFASLRIEIDGILENGFFIENPATGNRESIQSVINFLYSLFSNGIRYNEVSNLNLTYDEIAQRHISYFEFATNAFNIFYGYHTLVFSPVTLKRVTVQVALNDLASLHKNGYDYTAISNLDYSYAELAGLNLTYHTFAFNTWMQ